jgi:hypothetical protein
MAELAQYRAVTRRRWVWAAVLAAWAVLLVVLAVVTQGDPTVAQQQTAAAARPTVDRVLAGAVALAGDDVVVAVGPYQRMGTCSLSATRDGVQYKRTADLYGRSGDTQRLLDRYLTGLPSDDNARRLSGPDGVFIGADPPKAFVRLSVKPVGADVDGHVQVAVNTGCRPVSSRPHPEFLAAPSDSERVLPETLAAALGVDPSTWRRSVLACPSGGTYTTVTAQGAAGDATLAELLHPDLHSDPRDTGEPAPELLNQSASQLVERQDGTGLVIRLTGGTVRVDATGPCG